MRTASTLMLILSVLFIMLKLMGALVMVFIPTSDHLAVYALNYGQIVFGTILYIFIAVVLIYIKENPVRGISYLAYTGMGIFSTLAVNLIITYFKPNQLVFWSIIGGINTLLLINLVIQSYFIKNVFLKPAYVLQAWSMFASLLVFYLFPYLSYNVLHQQEPSKIPNFFNVITDIALVYLIFRIREYFNLEYFQKKVQEFF